MEINQRTAQTMIESRFHEYPQMKAVADGEHFSELISQILDFREVDQSFLPLIEDEIVIVLALYAPLYELGQNIQESTGLSLEVSESIASLVETLILQPVHDELVAYGLLWRAELEKTPSPIETFKDAIRKNAPQPIRQTPPPQAGQSGPRPLTREEVLRALSPIHAPSHTTQPLTHEDNPVA